MASTNVMDSESSFPGSPPRIFLFSYPRTTSNLFMRILSLDNQPNFIGPQNNRYFFLPAMRTIRELKLLSSSHETWTVEQKDKLKDTLQECSDALQEFVGSAASNNQGVVVKEHVPFLTDPRALSTVVQGDHEPRIDECMKINSSNKCSLAPHLLNSLNLPSNATVLPNDFLLTWIPTFLIRHPALAFPSYYRMMVAFRDECPQAMEEMESELTAVMTLKWMRRLFDWYASVWEQDNGSLRHRFRGPLANGPKPIVLDSGDIISTPEATMGQFCDTVGLDATKLKFTWESGPQETVVKSAHITRSTLFSSTGVIKGNPSSCITLDEEVGKWKREFGEVVAAKLEKAVKDAMPDYEYLKSHKLTSE